MGFELYIHIPFCIKKCEYCDFLSGIYDDRVQELYTKALCTQIKHASIEYKGRTVTTIYIGGGTPSWLNENLLAMIMENVYKYFYVSGDAEVSIECNPGTLSIEKLKTYKKIGINRISIGLQSANDDELRLLGRIHTYDRFITSFENVRRAGFDNVNIDIMTGLPFQTIEKLENTLRCVTTLRPEHISAYALQIEEGTNFYSKYKFDLVARHAGMKTDALPSEEQEYNLYRKAIDYLESKGYHRYEISNYCLKGNICFHNLGYWNREEYLGLGLGASSLIKEHRLKNFSDMKKYIEAADLIANGEGGTFIEEDEPVSRKDAMAEFMFLGLRQTSGVSRSDFNKMFNCDIEGIYGKHLRSLCEQGFMEINGGQIKLTDIGIDLSNQVLSKFLLD